MRYYSKASKTEELVTLDPEECLRDVVLFDGVRKNG